MTLDRRAALVALSATLSTVAVATPAARALAGEPARNAERPSEAWDDIRRELWEGRPILDGAGMIALDTPYRAHDAAIVPVAIDVVPAPGHRVTKLTLIVDENPMPVAADIEVGPSMGEVLALATRVRVNAYSNVRVVAEMDDGALYQRARFVKATGGCAAPALKDADEALASLGKMKLRQFAEAPVSGAGTTRTLPPGTREAQILVRHPNYSGFQMNQLTHLFIPAHFVDRIEVRQGEDLVFRMTGGISISEDPSFRFAYLPNGAPAFEVDVGDTDGARFSRSFPTTPAS